MARGVAVTWLGFLGSVFCPHRRVPARRRLAIGVVPHVLHVALPLQFRRRKLVANVGDRRRIHAADAALHAVGFGGWEREVVERLAVGLVFGVRRLAGDEGDVVVVALVPGRVIVFEQRSLRRKSGCQVGVGRRVAERRGV